MLDLYLGGRYSIFMTDLEHHQNKQKAAIAVKKAAGTTTKIINLIEKDEYCPNIIQQIDAAIGLLQASKKTLLKGHLNHCLEDNLKKDKTNAIEELIRIFDLKN